MRRPIATAVIASTLLALVGCTPSGEETATESSEAADAIAPETLDAMPEAFLGRWDFSQESCGDMTSDMRLDIAADSIHFYESSAEPIRIVQQEPGSLVVDHRFSGEGEEWEEQLAYELSEDSERLTVTTADGSFSTRMRCSGETASSESTMGYRM